MIFSPSGNNNNLILKASWKQRTKEQMTKKSLEGASTPRGSILQNPGHCLVCWTAVNVLCKQFLLGLWITWKDPTQCLRWVWQWHHFVNTSTQIYGILPHPPMHRTHKELPNTRDKQWKNVSSEDSEFLHFYNLKSNWMRNDFIMKVVRLLRFFRSEQWREEQLLWKQSVVPTT